eukprot:6785650-Prymnesium_polylepis.1
MGLRASPIRKPVRAEPATVAHAQEPVPRWGRCWHVHASQEAAVSDSPKLAAHLRNLYTPTSETGTRAIGIAGA